MLPLRGLSQRHLIFYFRFSIFNLIVDLSAEGGLRISEEISVVVSMLERFIPIKKLYLVWFHESDIAVDQLDARLDRHLQP